jgi:hypothetical protein
MNYRNFIKKQQQEIESLRKINDSLMKQVVHLGLVIDELMKVLDKR